MHDIIPSTPAHGCASSVGGCAAAVGGLTLTAEVVILEGAA